MVIQPIDEEIYQVDANQGTRMIYQLLEQLICRYPEHYHWSYKRFSANKALKKIYDIDEKEALEKVDEVRNQAMQQQNI